MRIDLSTKVIHFTKGQTPDDFEGAYYNFKSILDNRIILPSSRGIKGGSECICFTETPINLLSEGLRNTTGYTKASSFGLMFDKEYLFQIGARPVIYQTDEEFYLLPEALQWRHVRYEPSIVDFTWEREWRLVSNGLQISPKNVTLIFPSAEWAKTFINDFKLDQEMEFSLMEAAVGYEYAVFNRESFTFNYEVLK